MASSILNGSSLPNDSLLINCEEHFLFSLIWIVPAAICVIPGFPLTLLIVKYLINKSNQNVSNDLFIKNLIFINLFFMGAIPFTILNSLVWNYEPLEPIYVIVDAFILCARPLFVTCICVDCYFAVVHPIGYMNSKKILVRKLACIVVWISTIGFSAHKGYKMYNYPSYLNSAPLFFVLPVTTFCNISTFLALKKADPTKKNFHPQKKRALRIIFSSLVVTFISYIPPVFIFSSVDLIPMSRERYECTVVMFGFMFSMSGCVIMPVLHLHIDGKFDNLKDMMKKYLCTCRITNQPQ